MHSAPSIIRRPIRGRLLAASVCGLALSALLALTATAQATQPSALKTTVAAPSSSYSIWSSSIKPKSPADSDASSVQLGVQFRTNTAGWVHGLRYYKMAEAAASPQGSLWSGDGKLLARATFPAGTAAGWQVAPLTVPIQILPGVSYVSSYSAPKGRYADDQASLGGGATTTSSALTALAGVYSYSGFPNQTWRNSNYYADVVFSTEAVISTSASSSTTQSAPTVSPPTTSVQTNSTSSRTSTSVATSPVVTATTTASTTSPPPNSGFIVGSGSSKTIFPSRPGLTTPASSLTPYSGPTTVTGSYSQANCVVTKQIRVNAGGSLSLNNCWIKVNVADSGYGMIGKSGRININHSLIDGSAFNNYTFPLILEGGGVVSYNEFIGNTDNVRLSSNTTFEWNYIHNPKRSSGGDAHSDGVELYYGARQSGSPAIGPHIFVRNNYIDINGSVGTSGGINVTNDFGPIDGVRIEGNTIMPGNIDLYLRGDGYCGCGGNLKDIEVINNRFVADHEFYPGGYNQVVSYQPEAGVTIWQGNTFIGPSGTTTAFGLGQL